MNNLKKMLDQKGIQLLDLASPSYLPGHLVKIHYFWRFGDFRAETRLDEDRGLATDILQVPVAIDLFGLAMLSNESPLERA